MGAVTAGLRIGGDRVASGPMAIWVYKICTAHEWAQAQVRDRFEGSADDARDGFIHLSTAAQVPGTAARHFQGRQGLMLLAVDADELGAALKWERSRGGEKFPHLYAPLPVTAVAWARPLQLGPEGMHLLPGEMAS